MASDRRELFRYVRLERPRIIDVGRRVKADRALAAVVASPRVRQRTWARTERKSGRIVTDVRQLKFNYLAYLKVGAIDSANLPTRTELKNVADFESAVITRDQRLAADRRQCLVSVLACRILGRRADLTAAAKLLDFVDNFPLLARVSVPAPYAVAVFERFDVTPVRQGIRHSAPSSANKQASTSETLTSLRSDLQTLWRARNAMRNEAIREHRAKVRTLIATRFAPPPTSKPRRKALQRASEAVRRREAGIARKALLAHTKTKIETLSVLRTEHLELQKSYTLEAMLNASGITLPGMASRETRAMLATVRQRLSEFGITPTGFCTAFEAVVSKNDTLPVSASPADGIVDGCFKDTPVMTFGDSVRPLGVGRLVKVEESFNGYRDGEVSYIENVLAGETRRRRVKRATTTETTSELFTEESTDVTSEQSTRASQELASEVKTELNTRFNSDISASANAQGSGKLGVMDVSGSAGLNIGLGIGVESSLSTSDSSKFSQEIIDKAIERTRRTVAQRRVSRIATLLETIDVHQIKNTGTAPRSGIYCFLDKEVSIREIAYGQRLLLLATLVSPGRNLVCDRRLGIGLAKGDLGERPRFDVSPAEIHPHNYQAYVAQFRASNVLPPPSPIKRIARTYKTDSTNANFEQQELKLQNVAELLVPFFKRYKRFLLTDTIPVPEGYRIQDVAVTVNHGSNGVSIPAHLPFSLGGAAMYAAPGLVSAVASMGIMLPYVLWQTMYLASPLLHFNADSSNVTVTVGNQSDDSPYYFFEPDFLIREVFDLLSNFTSLTPDLLQQIPALVTTMLDELGTNAAAFSTDLGTAVGAAVNTLFRNIKAVVDALIAFINPTNLFSPNAETFFSTFQNAVTTFASGFSSSAFTDLIGRPFFEPIKKFIDACLDLFSGAVTNALSDLVAFFTQMFENNQTLFFNPEGGLGEEVPVAFNIVSLKPGVTLTLTACALRTDETLDKWRQQTFEALYQAYLQQVAEHENRMIQGGPVRGLATSPALMRREESTAIKELILNTLNNHHGPVGNQYSAERINFFENALDWENMSYKLYNYGPDEAMARLRADGVFANTDERRVAFLSARWAQVIVPAQESEHLAGQVTSFFESGTFDFDGGLSEPELAALYQGIVTGQPMGAEGTLGAPRTVTLPTDLIVLRANLPVGTP